MAPATAPEQDRRYDLLEVDCHPVLEPCGLITSRTLQLFLSRLHYRNKNLLSTQDIWR